MSTAASDRRLVLGIVLALGSWLSIGCTSSAGDQGAQEQAEGPAPERWWSDEPSAFSEAGRTDRYIAVDFRAKWCQPCERLEEILAKPEVHAELTRDFVPLALDVTRLTPKDNELKAKYKVFTLPAVVFVGREGQELGRFEGEVLTEAALLAELRRVMSAHPRPVAAI